MSIATPETGRSAAPSEPVPDLTGLHVAYVVQRYPKVSHVFIQREITALRSAGAQVDTYSLRAAESSDLLSARDREEGASTCALRPIAAMRLLRSHFGAFARDRRAYVATLAAALRAAPPGLKARIWQALYFGQAVVLHDQLRRRGTRHVHAHLANVATDVTWLAVELANRSDHQRWTWSFTMHGPTEFHEVKRFNLARKVAAADLVVCISDFCRSQLMAIADESAWSKLAIVHCGVDVDDVDVFDRSAREPRQLLSIGRLVPEKAQWLLLETIDELVRRGHDVTATIVGDGPEAERLHELRQRLGLVRRVEFPGALGQDDLARRFDDADTFVMASFDEGVPVVLMEAMASGLPVVATRIAGIPELIDDGVNGLLVAPGRADLLADAIERTWFDPELRSALTKVARMTIEREFNATTEAAKLGERFRECIAAENSR